MQCAAQKGFSGARCQPCSQPVSMMPTRYCSSSELVLVGRYARHIGMYTKILRPEVEWSSMHGCVRRLFLAVIDLVLWSFKQQELRGGIFYRISRPNFPQSSSRIALVYQSFFSRMIVDLLSYERKTTDKREQYDWIAEKNLVEIYTIMSEKEEVMNNTCSPLSCFLWWHTGTGKRTY